MKKFNRKEIRLKDFDYNSIGSYYLTLCSNNKEKIFSIVNKDDFNIVLTTSGKIVEDSIIFMGNREGIQIDKYVIMPNHIHMIFTITDSNNNNVDACNSILSKNISRFKRYTNKLAEKDLWQRGYYEHIIRNEKDYYEKWTYIDENPIYWSTDEYYGDGKY